MHEGIDYYSHLLLQWDAVATATPSPQRRSGMERTWMVVVVVLGGRAADYKSVSRLGC